MRLKRLTTHLRRVRLAAVVIVGVLVVLAAAWAAPRTSRAAAEPLRTPQVRLDQIEVPGGLPVTAGRSSASSSASRAGADPQPVTLDAGMRFFMVGVICDTPDAAGEVVVQLRTSNDGQSWSRWYQAALEYGAQGGQAGESFIEPLWTGAGRYVQVSARAGTARAPLELGNVRVVAIDSVEQVAAESGVPVSAAARVSLAAPAAVVPAAPPIVTRQEWGADESLRGSAPSYATVKMAFVHHTASDNVYTQADAPAIVRGIYAYHTQALGWNDIGYNFLIDRFGTIYEGRYGGVAEGVVGAQVLGFNTGSTGVSVIGTYVDEAPPAAAVTALENLLAWKLSPGGLDPLGTAKMTCGSTEKFKAGAAVTLPVIAGHRDANYTECPGDALYALLPTV
ncbi:MAG TPA: peptidoglycan recognition protein, partial [Thermoleophilia bacterium]